MHFCGNTAKKPEVCPASGPTRRPSHYKRPEVGQAATAAVLGLCVMDDSATTVCVGGAATETVRVGGAVCYGRLAVPPPRMCVGGAVCDSAVCVGTAATGTRRTQARWFSLHTSTAQNTRVSQRQPARARTRPARVTRPWRPAAAAPPPTAGRGIVDVS